MPSPLMNQVLIVEGSTSIRELTASRIRNVPTLIPVCAADYQQAAKLLATDNRYLCAVVGLVQNDAPNGEAAKLTCEHSIPTIILTATHSESHREVVHSPLIIDTVAKESLKQIDYIAEMASNIYAHQTETILVVDDSQSHRNYMVELLNNLRYPVITADSGAAALEILDAGIQPTLGLIDHNMPGMSGIELVQKVRLLFSPEELALIGISANQDSTTTVGFLKSGANDYLSKPFSTDEFYARINQSAKLIHHIRTLSEIATTDHLTRLKNRHTLFSMGNLLYSNARRGDLNLAVGMIDADHFKQINDQYGHGVGDQVLVKMADTLTGMVRNSDIIARFGGEEFVFVAVVNSASDAFQLFERTRKQIEQIEVLTDTDSVGVTVSIGFTVGLGTNFNSMIARADQAVYQAKTNGRNRTIEH